MNTIEHVMRAFGWTMLHSLGYGFVIACLTGLFAFMSAGRTPAFRYVVFVFALVLFLALSAISFVVELRTPPGTEALFIPYLETSLPAIYEALPAGRWGLEIAGLLATILPVLFITWAITSAGKLTWLLYRFIAVRNLSRSIPLPPSLRLVLASIENKLNRPCPSILVSQEVTAPAVAGLLKPVALLPSRLVTGFSQKELEAVLLHEFAHVFRKDPLINHVQLICEALFFFNPGFVWLSGLIRNERELCCDDWVVKRTKDHRIYIKALTLCYEHQGRQRFAGLPFCGNNGSVSGRARRLANEAPEGLKINCSLLSLGFACFLLYTVCVGQHPFSAGLSAKEYPCNGCNRFEPAVGNNVDSYPQKPLHS